MKNMNLYEYLRHKLKTCCIVLPLRPCLTFEWVQYLHLKPCFPCFAFIFNTKAFIARIFPQMTLSVSVTSL